MQIGNRMKDNYESRSKSKLIRRMPVIIRLDGKAFHTFTRGCDRPFDEKLHKIMKHSMRYLLENIQGAKIGYQQSDEISILLTDYDNLQTDAWFDNNIQKICSVSASMVTSEFNRCWLKNYIENQQNKQFDDSGGNFPIVLTKDEWWECKLAHFDSRCFNIPKEEVNNYFVWRQKDWERNSIQMFARSYFSHGELHKKKSADIHEMIYKKGENWANLEDKWKNGTIIFKKDRVFEVDHSIIFTENRNLIEKFL